MSEEQQDSERYILDIGWVTVWIQDTVTGERIATFTGPDRLLNATAELNRLKSEEGEAKKLHPIEPSTFLADLTGYARRQRLTAMLKQVQEIETQAVALLADDARRLADATALRERLEKALKRPVSPASEPQSDQKPTVQGLDALVESGALKAFTGDAAQLFKPQPY